MDSLEAQFEMVKDVKTELSRKEDAVTGELRRMEKSYQDKLGRYQAQAATMTQVQSESATKDMMQMQQQMQNRKQSLDQEYQDFYMRKMKEVKNKIEDYLRVTMHKEVLPIYWPMNPVCFITAIRLTILPAT